MPLPLEFLQYEPNQPDGANHIPHTWFNQSLYLDLLLFRSIRASRA